MPVQPGELTTSKHRNRQEATRPIVHRHQTASLQPTPAGRPLAPSHRGNEIWGSVVARRHLADPTLELHRYRTAIVVRSIANPPKLVAPWPPSDQMAPCSPLAVDGNCPIGGRQFSPALYTNPNHSDRRTDTRLVVPLHASDLHQCPPATTGHRPPKPEETHRSSFSPVTVSTFDFRLCASGEAAVP